MATVGAFDFNLSKIGNTTNNSVAIAEGVTAEIAAQSSLIGLAIAISISLTLLFGAIFLVVNFIPALIGKIKGLKKA